MRGAIFFDSNGFCNSTVLPDTDKEESTLFYINYDSTLNYIYSINL